SDNRRGLNTMTYYHVLMVLQIFYSTRYYLIDTILILNLNTSTKPQKQCRGLNSG
ncbi:hypothetical protein LOTGIDRAFT_135048, partial [Lottia gigantea]